MHDIKTIERLQKIQCKTKVVSCDGKEEVVIVCKLSVRLFNGFLLNSRYL